MANIEQLIGKEAAARYALRDYWTAQVKKWRTPMDTEQGGKDAYDRGMRTGSGLAEFHISIGGVWSGSTMSGGHCQSYETLGYHANTAEFMRGVIESGVTIVDHRKAE
jgi:hypothetical protein